MIDESAGKPMALRQKRERQRLGTPSIKRASHFVESSMSPTSSTAWGIWAQNNSGLARRRPEGQVSLHADRPVRAYPAVDGPSADWGWTTDDSLQALELLKRFGSVTILDGHIHQIFQKGRQCRLPYGALHLFRRARPAGWRPPAVLMPGASCENGARRDASR